MTILIDQKAVEAVFSMDLAVTVIEDMYRSAGNTRVENPARLVLPIGDGFMRFGPGVLRDQGVAGFKVWANFGSGPARGWNFLFDIETGDLLSILHSYNLGAYRTSATSAVAAKYLAREDASTVGLFGTGRLAGPQLRALMKVRPITKVKAYSRNPASREGFAQAMSRELDLEVIDCESPEEAARDVDIIATVTNATTPMLLGKWINRPCLILGVGANQWYEREIDIEAVRKADLVVVDKKDQARIEGGDLLWPIAQGALTWDQVAELGEIVVGKRSVPDRSSSTIIFESHGLAIADVAVSAAAYDLVRQTGLGQVIDLTLGTARTEVVTAGAMERARR